MEHFKGEGVADVRRRKAVAGVLRQMVVEVATITTMVVQGVPIFRPAVMEGKFQLGGLQGNPYKVWAGKA